MWITSKPLKVISCPKRDTHSMDTYKESTIGRPFEYCLSPILKNPASIKSIKCFDYFVIWVIKDINGSNIFIQNFDERLHVEHKLYKLLS